MQAGRRATTQRLHARLLGNSPPDTRVEPYSIFVRDGEVYTLAGVSAGSIWREAESDHGSAMVRDVARSLVVCVRRAGGRSQFLVLVDADSTPQSPLRRVTDMAVSEPGGATASPPWRPTHR